MGFMDKVKAQATVLADKAQTGVQQGQTKLQEMQATKQADHLLRELGAYVFLSERGRTQPDSEAKVTGIMGELDALEAAGTEVTINVDPSAVPAGGAVPQPGGQTQASAPSAPPAEGTAPPADAPLPQSATPATSRGSLVASPSGAGPVRAVVGHEMGRTAGHRRRSAQPALTRGGAGSAGRQASVPSDGFGLALGGPPGIAAQDRWGHHHRQGRTTQDGLSDAARGDAVDPSTPDGSEHNRIALPQRGLFHDPNTDVFDACGARSTVRADPRRAQAEHRLVHEDLGVGGGLERRDPCDLRKFAHVEHLDVRLEPECKADAEVDRDLA